MGLENWNKAEMVLQRILNRDPRHEVALYQLSQVFLEQNKTHLALECINSAAQYGCQTNKPKQAINKSTTANLRPETCSSQALKEPEGPSLWGTKCTTKAQLCIQIIIQEADILRAMRQYKAAAQVC